MQGLGPAASEVVASCPQNSFYAENFYMGATLLGAFNATDTLGECCVLCRCVPCASDCPAERS